MPKPASCCGFDPHALTHLRQTIADGSARGADLALSRFPDATFVVGLSEAGRRQLETLFASSPDRRRVN